MIRTLRVLRHSAICARPLMPSGARPLSNSFVPSTAAKMGRAGVRTVFPVANRLAAGGLALGTACFASSTTLAEAEQTSVRLALCQMMCGSDKTANIAEARRCVEEAVAGGARLVALPECWNRCAACHAPPRAPQQILTPLPAISLLALTTRPRSPRSPRYADVPLPALNILVLD